MKFPFPRFNGTAQSPASLIAALVLVALVPAVCVVWFMTVAMRNERLAVQERLAEVYHNHLTSLQRQVTSFWSERQAALAAAAGDSPAEIFAASIRGHLADGAVVYDASGKALYPAAANAEGSTAQSPAWLQARELEFQKKDFPAAAATYGRIAQNGADAQSKSQALQAQAGCLLKAGQKAAALDVLASLVDDATLRATVSTQGTLIVPNAQLLMLKLTTADQPVGRGVPAEPPGQTSDVEASKGSRLTGDGSPYPETIRRNSRSETQSPLAALVARLNDYHGAAMPSSQRRFLMREVKTLAPGAALFPTLDAEELAAEYQEHEPARATDSKLQRTAVDQVWCLSSPDRTRVALFRTAPLKSELKASLARLALPDVTLALLAPNETPPMNKRLPALDAGEFMPGWRLALSFNGADPLASASERQSRVYLAIGFLVVLIIALLAFLVARYVAAQIRLARLKNDLVSTVSHELRTPLASMRALVDTLAAGRCRDERQQREYLQLITRENLRLSHLIENFLTFSRLERGSQRFHLAPVAPAALLAAAASALKDKLESPHCHFDLEVRSDLPRIHGDAEALTTVLINLLDNACKYTPDEKRISARAYADQRDVWFEVQDNGIGLAPEETRKIFERFYQVDQSLTRQRGGCGLGLSIIKSIVAAHHGAVEVKSLLGQGSTFRVRLPVAPLNA